MEPSDEGATMDGRAIQMDICEAAGRLPPQWDGSAWGRNLAAAGHRLPPQWDGWKPPPVGLWAWGLGFLKESLQNPSEVRQRSR